MNEGGLFRIGIAAQASGVFREIDFRFLLPRQGGARL